MHKILALLLLLVVHVNCALESQQITTKYGKYCGKDHYDNYGSQPVDVFDRTCQIHDICCASQGLLSCYCNEQLYWTLSNLRPDNKSQVEIKDFILKAIYVSVFQCSNYYLFDEYFYISKSSYHGFNYLPMRQEEPLKICTDNSPVLIFDVTDDDYMNFTRSAYDNPMSVVHDYHHQSIQSNACDYIYPNGRDHMKIIYNINDSPIRFQLIRKDRFRPLIHRGY